MARCRHACRVRPGVSGEEHADPPRRRRRQMCMCSLRTNDPAMTAHERAVTQKMDGIHSVESTECCRHLSGGLASRAAERQGSVDADARAD